MTTRLEESRGEDINLRSAVQMREYEEIVDRIGRDAPGRLLDWGCGYGQVTRLLRDAGVDAVAFDYRPDVRDAGFQPLERYPEIEAYLSSEPVRLPFDDDSFDSVLSCGVLEHVQFPDASLDELRRVLRPGGKLYVYKLPNRYSYLERLAKAVGLYYHGRAPFDRVYGYREAVDLLRRHGFEVTDARRMNMLPLTVGGGLPRPVVGVLWAVNRVLSRVPGINVLATNLELLAVARP
jgi:SAM-dependent methyltransferase